MKKIRNKAGFSFIEVIVATFIFVLMMTAVAMTFSSLFSGYKSAKTIQKNLENAQYAMNLMAKSLRTSSVVFPVSDGNSETVKFYDYSQKKCIELSFDTPGNLMYREISNSDLDDSLNKKLWCENGVFTDNLTNLTAGYVSGSFYVVPSSADSKTVGRVIISMEVCSDSTCKNSARIQSAVSLRDYGEAGLQ